MSTDTSVEMTRGLHVKLDAEGVTFVLFSGPKGSGKRGGAVWSLADKIIDEQRFDLADYPPVLEDDGEGEGAGPKSFAAYGLSKLLSDRTSQCSGDPEAKLTEMRRYSDVFKNGLWRERKAGGGGGGRKARVDLVFVLAVMRVQKLKQNQLAKVTAALEAKDSETLKKIRALDSVKEAMREIRAEQAEEQGEAIDLGFDLPEGDTGE